MDKSSGQKAQKENGQPSHRNISLQSYYRERLTAHLDALRVFCLTGFENSQEDPWSSICRMARRLRRTSGMYGFPEISQAAERLLNASDKQQTKRVNQLIQVLEQAIDGSKVERVAVLVVEADQDIARMLQVTLTTANRDVIIASSAKQAREIVSQQEISLIVLNLNLPREDGRDLLLEFRENGGMERVPILVLCPSNSSQIMAECFALGANSVFADPYDPAALSSAVSTRLRRQAMVGGKDRITGLPNRATFQEAFQRIVTLKNFSEHALSVAVLSFDHFSSIDELYGGKTSNEVLQKAVEVIMQALRDADLLARWQHDKFVALFPNATVTDAVSKLEKALYAVQHTSFKGQSGHVFDLSFSAGVVAVASATETLTPCIQRAEKHVEQARSSGGGQIVTTAEGLAKAKTKILLVEDDAAVLSIVKRSLEREGFKVTSFMDGTKAVEAAPGLAAHAVVLDVKLPGMDGFEILRRLRKTPAYAHQPIILLSALTEEQHVVQGLELGADDYIVKPFSPPELIARVKRHLEKQTAGATHTDPTAV